MTVKTERKGKISLQMGLEEYWLFQSSPNHSKSSLHKHENAYIEYAESNSDLGDDEERILMHDDHTFLVPSDNDDNDDDESTPKWKWKLSERA